MPIDRPAVPRLAPLDPAPGRTNVTGLLAYAGDVGRAFQDLGAALHNGALSPRERELIILRTAWRTGNRYAFGRHRIHANRIGIADPEVDAVATEHGRWAAAEDAVFAAVDELCAEDCLSQATWDALLAGRTIEQVAHVVLLAGFQRQLAGWLNSTGAELEDGLHSWD